MFFVVAGRTLQIVAGLVLLAAAGMKLQEWLFGTAGFSLPPAILLVGWQLELLVGLWLVSGFHARYACVAGAGLYLLLGGVNLWSWSIGKTECGCLGSIPATPLAMLGFDLLLAAGLWLAATWTKPVSGAGPSPQWKFWIRAAVLASLVFLGVATVARFSGKPGPLGALRDKSICIATQNLGELQAGSTVRGTLRLQNRSNRPISLIGARDLCNVRFLPPFPKVIESGAFVDLPMILAVPRRTGRFQIRVRFYIQEQGNLAVFGWVRGRAIKTHPPPVSSTDP